MREAAESTTTMPPGDYWVGDPCYAFDDHSLWMKLLESANYKDNRTILEAEAEGRMFIASSTAYGDGMYEDQMGRRYPVDAGLLGATPAIPGEPVPKGMNLITFETPIEVTFFDGDVTIGHVIIQTDPKAECDECGEVLEYGEGLCFECESRIEEEEADR